jgi:hypothetical protein
VDFSRKRKILKTLTERGKKNKLLFLPCLIISLFVKLFYNIATRLDLLFSDDKGRVFGIEKTAKKADKAKSAKQADIKLGKIGKRRARKNSVDPIIPALEGVKPVPRKPVPGSKRPASARLVSAILSVCFVFTFLPATGLIAEAAAEIMAPFDINGDLDGNGVFDESNYTSYLTMLGAPDGYPSTYQYEYRTINDNYILPETVTMDIDDTGAGDGKLVIYFHKTEFDSVPANKLFLPIYTTYLTIYGTDGTTVLRQIPVNYDSDGYANDPIIVLEGDELTQSTISYKLTNEYRRPVYQITKKQNKVMSNPTDGAEPVEISPAVDWGIDQIFQTYKVIDDVVNGSGSYNKDTFNKKQEDISSIESTIDYTDPLYPNGKASVRWTQANEADGYILHKINRDTGVEEGAPITLKNVDGVHSLQYPPAGSTTVYNLLNKSTVYDFEVIPYKGITKSAATKNPQTDTPFFIYGKNSGNIYGTVVSLMEPPAKGIGIDKATPISPKGYEFKWNGNPKIANAAEVAANPDTSPSKAGYNIYRLPLSNIITASGGALDLDSTHEEITAYINDVPFLANDMAMLKNASDGSYNVDNKTTSFSDIDANAGEQYYYAITAYRTPDTVIYESKPLFIPTSTTSRPGVPQGVEALPNSNRIYLKWDAVRTSDPSAPVAEYADSYIVSFTLLDAEGNPTSQTGTREVTVSSQSELMGVFDPVTGNMTSPISIEYYFDGATQRNITNGNRYAITVQAVKERVRGSLSSQVKVLAGGTPSQPDQQSITVTPSDNTITIEWAPVLGADYYYVTYGERDTNGVVASWSDPPTKVNTNRFVHGNLDNGKLYGYKITAAKDVGTGAIAADALVSETLVSDQTAVVYGIAGNNIPAPVDPGFSQTGNVVSLSWKAGIAGNTDVKIAGYYVNITGSDSTVQSIPITSTSYKHTITKEDVTYSYSVQAYAVSNGVPTKSTALEFYDKGYVAKPTPEPPPAEPPGTEDKFLLNPRDFTVTAGDNKADLKWTAVTGANGYIVHAEGPGGKFQFDVTKPSFAHTGLDGGSKWTYYVVAYFIDENGAQANSKKSESQTVTIGGKGADDGSNAAKGHLPAPLDFRVSTTDGQAILTWTAVADAYSYTVHAVSFKQHLTFDVSKPGYVHDRLLNGEEWTYYVTANTLSSNGTTSPGISTTSIDVIIGVTLAQPQDLTAINGNRQVDLMWLEVDGAEGYIVYLYNDAMTQFEPLSVVSEPFYSHTGLVNGKKYSYMVTAYKYTNNEQTYSPYSMTVFGVPTTGSPSDLDRVIEVKGALPYGMDHSELVDVAANHGAFDEDVEVYVSSSDDATNAVRDTLQAFGNGVQSFIAYPFDITVYYAGTRVEATPNSGFGVTFTMPLPDELVRYRDYINVLHVNEFGEMEILNSELREVDGDWCISFIATGFSPYGFVVYKDQIIDASSGTAAAGSSAAGNMSLAGMLSFTAMYTRAVPTIRKYSRRRIYRVKSVR